jgi:hypothetical protein
VQVQRDAWGNFQKQDLCEGRFVRCFVGGPDQWLNDVALETGNASHTDPEEIRQFDFD